MATLKVETIKLIGNGVLDVNHVAVLLQAGTGSAARSSKLGGYRGRAVVKEKEAKRKPFG